MTDVAIVNSHACTRPLAWYVQPSAKLEPVGGVVPMNPPRVMTEPLRPGLNYISSASLEAACGSDLDKLPPGIQVEEPTELRGKYLDEVIGTSSAPALSRWLGEEKRPEPRKKIEARLAEIASRRAAA